MLNISRQIIFLFVILVSGAIPLYSSDALSEVAKGLLPLPNGIYLIERIYPPEEERIFYEEDPETGEKIVSHVIEERTEPRSEYYKLYLRDNEFILYFLVLEEGEFVPSETFEPVSESDAGSWVLNPMSNRVTLIKEEFDPKDDHVPVIQRINNRKETVRRLRLMGAGGIDWSSVEVIGKSRFSGMDETFGNRVVGEFHSSYDEGVLNIFYTSQSGYQVKIDLTRDPDPLAMTSMSASRASRPLEKSEWKLPVVYNIREFEPIPEQLDMSTYWERFRDSDTVVHLFDPETLTTSLIDQDGTLWTVSRDAPPKPDNRKLRFVILPLLVMMPLLFWVVSRKRKVDQNSAGNT